MWGKKQTLLLSFNFNNNSHYLRTSVFGPRFIYWLPCSFFQPASISEALHLLFLHLEQCPRSSHGSLTPPVLVPLTRCFLLRPPLPPRTHSVYPHSLWAPGISLVPCPDHQWHVQGAKVLMSPAHCPEPCWAHYFM